MRKNIFSKKQNVHFNLTTVFNLKMDRKSFSSTRNQMSLLGLVIENTVWLSRTCQNPKFWLLLAGQRNYLYFFFGGGVPFKCVLCLGQEKTTVGGRCWLYLGGGAGEEGLILLGVFFFPCMEVFCFFKETNIWTSLNVFFKPLGIWSEHIIIWN